MSLGEDPGGALGEALGALAAHPPAVDWDRQVRRGVARRQRAQRLATGAVVAVTLLAGAAVVRSLAFGPSTVIVDAGDESARASAGDGVPARGTDTTTRAPAPASLGSSAMPEGLESHLDAVHRTERDTGRRLGLNHQYYRWDTAFPNDMQAEDRREGRTPFLNWAARMDGTAAVVSWASIAGGAHDNLVAARARGLRDLSVPVVLSFSGGPYDQSLTGFGTPAEFAAAFRHVVAVFRANGATNVAFAWVMDGEDFAVGRADAFYPGDDVVDWIGASGFNFFQRTGRWDSLAALLTPFLDWARAHDRTVFVPEFATEEDPADPLRKAGWLDDAHAFLRSQPQVRAAVYFNADGMRSADGLIFRWHVDSSPAALDAWRRLAHDPWFGP